jgi:hypothetical protein
MKFHSRSVTQWILCLLVSIFLLNGYAFASPEENGPNSVQIESMSDILQEEVADFKHAVDETVKYYSEAGLPLNKPVTIVLTRNRKAFLAEAASRFGISEIEVNRVGKGVDALSGNRLIVINVDGTPTSRQRTFLLAHELTHQYQRQIAGAKAVEVKWMLEGMAEAVGAQIVARNGFMSTEQYKANWQTGICIAKNKPYLTQLRTSQDWSNALSVYGSGLTYKTAGWATLLILEEYGLQSIIDYFGELGQGKSSSEAFRNSFEIDMLQYEKSMEMRCRKAS